MQALQKAAKEREGTAHSLSEGSAMTGDLSLEPLEGATPTKPSAGTSASGSYGGPTPAQAAAVLQSAEAGPGVVAWLQDHRRAVYGGLIGAILLGYGAYFYVSVYHPALLRRPLSPQIAANVPPAAPLPPAVPALPEATTATGSANALPAGSDAAATEPGPQSRPAARSGGTAESRPRMQPPAPSTTPGPRQPHSSIAVRPGGEGPRISPQLVDAYDALRTGRIEDAKRLYDAVLLSEPRNIDALLGRAMVAQQQVDLDLATRYLYQVIQLEPSNSIAQGGLINLLGRADPQSAESRLKSLISKDPSAFLYFALGNLYADQGNWPAAQASYFQAHHFQPDSPDYVYNLAVSLEHLSQPKLALSFYRQALELAKSGGRANFDSASVQERVVRLAAGVD
jgi:Flp pilus assembly protein TadD